MQAPLLQVNWPVLVGVIFKHGIISSGQLPQMDDIVLAQGGINYSDWKCLNNTERFSIRLPTQLNQKIIQFSTAASFHYTVHLLNSERPHSQAMQFLNHVCIGPLLSQALFFAALCCIRRRAGAEVEVVVHRPRQSAAAAATTDDEEESHPLCSICAHTTIFGDLWGAKT